MSFISNMLGGGAQTTPAANPEPAPNPGPAPNAAPAPGTTPAPAPAPAPNNLQLPPNAAPAPAPAPTPAPVDVYAALMNTGTTEAPLSAEDQAAQFVSSLMAAPQVDPTANAAPALNMQRVNEMLPNLNLAQGMDAAATLEALQGENGAEALSTLMQQSQANTITAMVPLMNALVQEAVSQVTTTAVQQSHHDLTSSAIITQFNQTHPYGTHPSIKPMLEGFANTIAQSAPRNVPVDTLVAQLHNVFQGLGNSMNGGPQGDQTQQFQPGGAFDMSGTFK